MFTGIIKGVGRVVELAAVGGDRRLCIDAAAVELGAIALGDSVAVNGVCLTVVEQRDATFCADVSLETLTRTTLERLNAGDAVNLEPALRVGDPLGGHFVSGHVDGVGRVRRIEPDGRSQRIAFELDAALLRYVATKGSIAVDGVSLTVNGVDGTGFDVNIVPHTREMTAISGYRVGTAVNIEVDVIARYLERLGAPGGVDLEFLQAHGYTVEER
jgi:riboflavin synthase